MEISLVIAIYVLGVTTGALIAIAVYSDRRQPRCAQVGDESEHGAHPL